MLKQPKGELIKDTATRILSSEDGRTGQVNLGNGFLYRGLQSQGYAHVEVRCLSFDNSLLSLYPRKNASGYTTPIKFQTHGGAIIDLPRYPEGWIGPKWSKLTGRGWIALDVWKGKSYSLRLMMPTDQQFDEAFKRLRASSPIYPGFD